MTAGPDAVRRFLVSGRVQGVFFRASTARRASELRLRGLARNLPDGRVEVLAAGRPEALAALEAWLREGPPSARVERVQSEECGAGALAGFEDFRTG